MMPSKLSLCFALCLIGVSHASNVADKKTTEAVVKAVVKEANNIFNEMKDGDANSKSAAVVAAEVKDNAEKTVVAAEKAVAVATTRAADSNLSRVAEGAGAHGEVAAEKTTEAVVKAVVQAENKPQGNVTAQKEANNKEAEAVVNATTEVLASESQVTKEVTTKVIDEAATRAKSTFKDMKDGGVSPKSAAALAAKVEIATIDEASGLKLPKKAKDSAEKAAVVASQAVADHPNDQGQALAEAITTIESEENISGKVNLKQKDQGMVAKVKAAASNLSNLAEGVVAHGAEQVENMESGKVADEKTTQAVVKAVVQAEKTQGNTTNHKAAKTKEAAEAVANATTEVLVSESQVTKEVDTEVINEAATKAKSTYKELKDSSVKTKTAAVAAAEVEVATIDGASGVGLPKEAKDNAEKAAVVAGKAVADHPNDQAQALAEAVTQIKKEENTSGKMDLKPKAQGMVASAEAAVSNLPQFAEGAVIHGAEHVENLGGGSKAIGVFAIMAVLGGCFVIGKKAHTAHFEVSPYMKRLNLIREEFNTQGEIKDLETQYANFQELNEMRQM